MAVDLDSHAFRDFNPSDLEEHIEILSLGWAKVLESAKSNNKFSDHDVARIKGLSARASTINAILCFFEADLDTCPVCDIPRGEHGSLTFCKESK